MFLDQIKTFVLLSALTFLLLIIGFALGGTSGLAVALIITIIINTLSYWYSDKIVLKMYNAKKAGHSEYQKLHEIVKEISIRASIKNPKVYIIDSENPNAFATGRNEKKAIIAVTKGLLELLSEQELKGVIAHEIGHIKNKDLLISTVSVILASAIAYIAVMARWFMIFGGSREGDSMGIAEIIVLSIVAPLSATILRLAISRSREFIADETGARIIRDPEALANALIKLESAPKLKEGNRAASNLFIVNPFSSNSFFKLFSTHPSTTDRVKKLRKLSFSMV
ncbi:M48 family metalloprotease [archaeon]|nr:M48 family metalloprotease [archaeon]